MGTTQELSRRPALLALALAALTMALYAPVCGYRFIDLDDIECIIINPRVGGLSKTNLQWAWNTFYFVSWHPLTWLSWQLDGQLFHLLPWGYHFGSILLHAAATAV